MSEIFRANSIFSSEFEVRAGVRDGNLEFWAPSGGITLSLADALRLGHALLRAFGTPVAQPPANGTESPVPQGPQFIASPELVAAAVTAYGEDCEEARMRGAIETAIAIPLIVDATREAAMVAKQTSDNCLEMAKKFRPPGLRIDPARAAQFEAGAQLAFAIAERILGRLGMTFDRRESPLIIHDH
jgi:hypothetical protein